MRAGIQDALEDAMADIARAVEEDIKDGAASLFTAEGISGGDITAEDRGLYERWKARVGEGKAVRYRQTPSMAVLHRSDALLRLMRGPVGSGKSHGCLMDIAMRCARQSPCRDGIVRNRALFARGTYQELKETTFDLWMNLFPRTEISLSPPIHGVLRQRFRGVDGKSVEGELQLLGCGMDQPKAESHVRSNPFSIGYLEEVQYIVFRMVMYIAERLGRFPLRNMAPERAGPGYFKNLGLTMNTNSSVDGDDYCKFERESDGVNRMTVVQPPAMFSEWDEDLDGWRYIPNVGQRKGVWPAENVENLNERWEYYFKLVRNGDEDYIRRNVLNLFGTRLNGLPVFPEFSRSWHVPENGVKPPPPKSRVFGGMDMGRTPRVLLMYVNEHGQMCVWKLLSRNGMGAELFVNTVLRPAVMAAGLNPGDVVIYGDPAGKGKDQLTEKTYLQILREAGFDAQAPVLTNNSPRVRVETVKQVLTRTTTNGRPMVVIDNGCDELIRGLVGGYIYARSRGAGGKFIDSDLPDKRCQYSHVCDAFQYLTVGMKYGGEQFGASSAREDYDEDARYASAPLPPGLCC